MRLGALWLATSCISSTPTPDQCTSFPTKISEASKIGVTIQDANTSEILNNAIIKINECYPLMEYHRAMDTIVLDKIALGSDGYFYIFYSFREVSDDVLVFRARKIGEIDYAFIYSPLSIFAVPN